MATPPQKMISGHNSKSSCIKNASNEQHEAHKHRSFMLKPSLEAGIVSVYHFNTHLHAKT